MNRLICYPIVLCILLPSCARQFSQGEYSPSVIYSTRKILSASYSQTPTKISLQEISPTSSNEIKNKITLSPTSTFNTTGIMTYTHSPKAECPDLHSNIPIPDIDMRADLENDLLDYLNNGGSPEYLQKTLQDYGINVEINDFTNDGVNEISISSKYPIISIYSSAYIFGCKNKKYIVLLTINNKDPMPRLMSDADMNLDGMPELPYEIIGWGANDFMGYYSIYEWDGEKFRNIISPEEISNKKVASGGSKQQAWMFNSDSKISDIDGNGTLELILYGGNDQGLSACDFGPVRNETDVWMWNGSWFSLASMILDPPEYRFQVVFDGDEASLASEYTKAEKIYWQAIQDNGLLGIEKFFGESSFCDRGIVADPAERPNLSAYSLYRILLIKLLQQDEQAESIYLSIQEEYPIDSYGHPFAILADIVWKEIIEKNNINNACELVIEYTDIHKEEILFPLGGEGGPYYYYGYSYQNRSYTSKDICPF